MNKITVVIPCYNEEKSIASVISKFPVEKIKQYGLSLEILVIDNNSSDKTALEAKRMGARVITEKKKGKGNAIRTGFQSVSDDTDFVVMLDGDETYSPQEILRLVEPLHNDFCEVVIGSRLGGRMHDNSMKTFNRAGNWVYTHLVRVHYNVNVTDVLTGYFAWKKSALDMLLPHLKSDGFAIEMEMITKMARLGLEIYSVPISYHPRTGDSNLRPIHDGVRILSMFTKNLRWKPISNSTSDSAD